MDRTFSSENFWIFDTHKYTNERPGGWSAFHSFLIQSMGLVYLHTYILPTWMVDFYGKLVGKYTIHGFYGFCIRFKQKNMLYQQDSKILSYGSMVLQYRISSRHTHLNIWLHVIPNKKKCHFVNKKRAGEFDIVSFLVLIGVWESSG